LAAPAARSDTAALCHTAAVRAAADIPGFDFAAAAAAVDEAGGAMAAPAAAPAAAVTSVTENMLNQIRNQAVTVN